MAQSLVGRDIAPYLPPRRPPPRKPVDLNLISAAIHHGCIGLPQELVDHIMDMLRNDLRALKACSSTCRAMFASTRRLIYHRIMLPPEGYFDDSDGLRFISLMGERDLLRYARKIVICSSAGCSPEMLLPPLRYFQSLDRVHTLQIWKCDVMSEWLSQYKTCFVHFYPTLTSLALEWPFGHYRDILRFALQFPNLEDLCIMSLQHASSFRSAMVIPALPDRSPPLRGRLRLEGAAPPAQYPKDLAYNLPNGINFRSVELKDFAASDAQHILSRCARTLENLTIAFYFTGAHRLSLLSLVITGRLAKFLPAEMTFCMCPHHVTDSELLLRVLSTVTSPVFCELVLELGGPSDPYGHQSIFRDRWRVLDGCLEERLSDRRDFKIIIREGLGWCKGEFRRHAKEMLPLLARQECIVYTVSRPKFVPW
jgi:hypothetical protein